MKLKEKLKALKNKLLFMNHKIGIRNAETANLRTQLLRKTTGCFKHTPAFFNCTKYFIFFLFALFFQIDCFSFISSIIKKKCHKLAGWRI